MAAGVTGTRTYRLAGDFRAFLAFALLFFIVVIGMIGFGLVADPRFPDVAFFLVWLAFVFGMAALAAFRGVTSITVEDGTVTFRTLLRTIRLPVSAIRSVETNWWDIRF